MKAAQEPNQVIAEQSSSYSQHFVPCPSKEMCFNTGDMDVSFTADPHTKNNDARSLVAQEANRT